MAQSPMSVVYMDPHLKDIDWGASAIYSEPLYPMKHPINPLLEFCNRVDIGT